MGLPPGFRFHPTDDELVSYYLKRKVEGQQIELEVIPVIELYKFDPWELPEKSFLPRRDLEWFFFCPRDRKYLNGSRSNRATTSGYWKATGKDRKVICESSVYGLRKTLVFYGGRAPGGERTDWMMHEYRLCEDFSQVSPNFFGAFALCRVVKRNEHGNKTSDVQGIPKAKRIHSSSSLSSFESIRRHSEVSGGPEENQYLALHPFQGSIDSTLVTSPSVDGRVTEPQVVTTAADQTSFWESNVLSDASKVFSEERGILYETTIPADFSNSADPQTIFDFSPVSSYVNLTLEAYLASDLSGNACMSTFPSPAHSMGMYNTEDNMDLPALEWNSQQFLTQTIYDTEAWNPVLPTICRQVSDVEEASLWPQEDNWVI